QGLFHFTRQGQPPAHTLAIERFAADAGAKRCKTGLNDRDIGKFATQIYPNLVHQRHLFSQAQALCGCATISTDQAARPQLDPPEPPYDQYGNLIALLAIDSLQDRSASRAAGFTIVIETILIP